MMRGATLQPKPKMTATRRIPFAIIHASSEGGTWLLAAARPGRSRRMKTVAKSSMTDAVMTIWDSLAWKLFDSSSILLIIAVLVVATTAATKTASILLRPDSIATPKTE